MLRIDNLFKGPGNAGDLILTEDESQTKKLAAAKAHIVTGAPLPGFPGAVVVDTGHSSISMETGGVKPGK